MNDGRGSLLIVGCAVGLLALLAYTGIYCFDAGRRYEREQRRSSVIQHSSGVGSPNVIGGGNVSIVTEPCDHIDSKLRAERESKK